MSPFFSIKGSETSSKRYHILMSIRHRLPKATKHPLINTTSWWVQSHFLRMASECSSLHNKLSVGSFFRKCCTIRDGAQTYDFIACLVSIILRVFLSGWEAFRTQGKCIKPYKNFWKDFVVKQNLTCLKGDFWSYLNRLSRFLSSLGIWIPATGR